MLGLESGRGVVGLGAIGLLLSTDCDLLRPDNGVIVTVVVDDVLLVVVVVVVDGDGHLLDDENEEEDEEVEFEAAEDKYLEVISLDLGLLDAIEVSPLSLSEGNNGGLVGFDERFVVPIVALLAVDSSCFGV